ncbi:hypothetical protein EYF80_054409 [Liparis tanakae]|uniref:Uncharacterized protein n=1 Tax=Liparis tanakae TaxID=230148 RepID=A0A4Z2F4M9_9TELE|nr:hypothetical protein EYF80_054409 [Liparis tanakae]
MLMVVLPPVTLHFGDDQLQDAGAAPDQLDHVLVRRLRHVGVVDGEDAVARPQAHVVGGAALEDAAEDARPLARQREAVARPPPRHLHGADATLTEGGGGGGGRRRLRQPASAIRASFGRVHLPGHRTGVSNCGCADSRGSTLRCRNDPTTYRVNVVIREKETGNSWARYV